MYRSRSLFLLTVLVGLCLTGCPTDPVDQVDDLVSSPALDTTDFTVDPGMTSPDLSALTVAPVLEVPIVDLSGKIEAIASGGTGPGYALGDVLCDEPCAFPFGAPLPQGIDNIGFEFVVKKGAEVRSSTTGFVHFIKENNNTQDFELHILLVEYGAYRLIYDHIQPTVSKGDVVEVGQVLGTAGPWGPSHGRVELQVNFEDPVTFETWAVCPAEYGTDDFVALHQKWLDMHNQAAVSSTHPHFQIYDNLCMVEKRFP